MRAMGPGSVASLLKTALDVVYYVLWAAVGLLALGAVFSLFAAPEGLTAVLTEGGRERAVPLTRPLTAAALAAFSLYAALYLIIVERVRRIFSTLSWGDPFHPDNVRRLRIVGVTLAGVTVLDAVRQTATASLVLDEFSLRIAGDPTAWFSVLVVFVLAEVFREGARLRREAELTI